MPTWLDALEAYCEEWRSYANDVRDGQIPPGATNAEIAELRKQADLRGLHLDHDVIALLRVVNGTSFDGLNFFGAALDDSPSYDRTDFATMNDKYNDQPSRYTLYGSWDIDLYRFNNLTRKYEVLDNGGGGVVKSFATYGELVQWAIMTHVLHDQSEQH